MSKEIYVRATGIICLLTAIGGFASELPYWGWFLLFFFVTLFFED